MKIIYFLLLLFVCSWAQTELLEITPRVGRNRDLLPSSTVYVVNDITQDSLLLSEYTGSRKGTYYRASTKYGKYKVYVQNSGWKSNVQTLVMSNYTHGIMQAVADTTELKRAGSDYETLNLVQRSASDSSGGGKFVLRSNVWCKFNLGTYTANSITIFPSASSAYKWVRAEAKRGYVEMPWAGGRSDDNGDGVSDYNNTTAFNDAQAIADHIFFPAGTWPGTYRPNGKGIVIEGEKRGSTWDETDSEKTRLVPVAAGDTVIILKDQYQTVKNLEIHGRTGGVVAGSQAKIGIFTQFGGDYQIEDVAIGYFVNVADTGYGLWADTSFSMSVDRCDFNTNDVNVYMKGHSSNTQFNHCRITRGYIYCLWLENTNNTLSFLDCDVEISSPTPDADTLMYFVNAGATISNMYSEIGSRGLFADNDISFTSGTKVIEYAPTTEDVTSNFDGTFAISDVIKVKGSASNDGDYTITAVTDTTITVSEALTDEAVGQTVVIADDSQKKIMQIELTSQSQTINIFNSDFLAQNTDTTIAINNSNQRLDFNISGGSLGFLDYPLFCSDYDNSSGKRSVFINFYSTTFSKAGVGDITRTVLGYNHNDDFVYLTGNSIQPITYFNGHTDMLGHGAFEHLRSFGGYPNLLAASIHDPTVSSFYIPGYAIESIVNIASALPDTIDCIVRSHRNHDINSSGNMMYTEGKWRVQYGLGTNDLKTVLDVYFWWSDDGASAGVNRVFTPDTIVHSTSSGYDSVAFISANEDSLVFRIFPDLTDGSNTYRVRGYMFNSYNVDTDPDSTLFRRR